MRWRLIPFLTGILLILSACSRPKQIIIGSKDTVEQQLLGEIAAQHLEHRLGIEVKRQFGLGDTRIVYQALLEGQIEMYPEYSGIIVRDLLRERPGTSPDIVYEYARLELKRRSLLEYLKPLGFDSRTTLVIATEGSVGVTTASQAAAREAKWNVGLSPDLESSLPGLNQYPFQMGGPVRTMKATALFETMEEKKVNAVLTAFSDGHLTSPKWKALEDDKNVFVAAEAAFLVRDDVLTRSPEARGALDQLAGKISLDAMRKMNAAVEIDERPVADVAAEFLRSSGLN